MLDANLADRKVVQYVINRFGIHAKHRLGQNFLVRPDIVAAIADAAEITPDVSVMEIGAGIGTLTQALAERGSDVIAFEVDQSLYNAFLIDSGEASSIPTSSFVDASSFGTKAFNAFGKSLIKRFLILSPGPSGSVRIIIPRFS